VSQDLDALHEGRSWFRHGRGETLWGEVGNGQRLGLAQADEGG